MTAAGIDRTRIRSVGDREHGRATTFSLTGADGLDRLDGPAHYAAAPASGFRAELTRVRLDHLVLEAFTATPHRCERSEAGILRFPVPMVSLIVLVEGRLVAQVPRGAYELLPGQCVVVDSREPSAYVASSPTSVLRAHVGIGELPEHLRDPGALVTGALRRTPLLDAFTALLSTVLRTASAEAPLGEHLARAMREIQSAVLVEAGRSG